MNKIYKLVWSKTKNMYVAVSEFAKSHTKSPSSGVISRTVVAGVLASVISCGAVMPVTLAAVDPGTGTNYVVYVDSNGTVINLEGPVGTGTKITNVAAGELSASSTDAVTGAQLYELSQTVDDFEGALTRNQTTIARVQTDVNNMKTANLILTSDVNTLKTQTETGFNVNINGAKVKTVNPDSNYINFVSGKGITLSNSSNGVKIDVSADGVVASGDTGAITGGLAYTELRPANGNYIAQANTTAQNLTALDGQLKTVTTGLAQEVTDRTTAVTNEATAREEADTVLTNKIGSINANGNYITKDGSVFTNLSALDTQLKSVSDNAGALSADGNYITQANTVAQNLQALDTKIGAASTANGTYTTTGNTVNANIKALDTQLKTTTDNLAQETTSRTTEDTNLSNRIGTVANGTYNYIQQSSTKNVAENLVLLDSALKTTNDTVTANKTAIEGALATEVSNRETADTALINKIGSVNADGNYITKDGTVFGNLSALDTRAKANADAIASINANAGALTENGNYILKDNTISQNLQALDTKVGSAESANGTYTTTANTVNANIKALDIQLKTTTDNLNTEITDRTNAINTEKTARETADTELGNRITALSGNAVHYDGEEKTAITLEGNGGTTLSNVKAGTLSADSKEAVNGSQLYTTNQALAQEVTDRTTAINTEKTARETADTNLMNKIGSIDANGNYITKDGTVFGNLSALDTQVKTNADAITTEATTRNTKDTELQNAIDALSNTSTNAIADEATARQEADTALTNKIGSIDADGNYITKDGTVFGNLSVLDTKLAQEVTDRTTADTALSNRIGVIDAGGTYNYITAGNNVSQNLIILDTQAKANASAIIAEQTARENAISQLTANIGTLSGNAIQYDGDTKAIATLGGASGTRLTNLAQGTLSASSTDAVTGAQLYATNQNISGFAADINRNKANIRDLNTSVSSALDAVSSASLLVDTINGLKADASLNNLTDAGRQVIASAAANAVQEYMAASGTNSTNSASPNSLHMASPLSMVSPTAVSVTDTNSANNDNNNDNNSNDNSSSQTMIITVMIILRLSLYHRN